VTCAYAATRSATKPVDRSSVRQLRATRRTRPGMDSGSPTLAGATPRAAAAALDIVSVETNHAPVCVGVIGLCSFTYLLSFRRGDDGGTPRRQGASQAVIDEEVSMQSTQHPIVVGVDESHGARTASARTIRASWPRAPRSRVTRCTS
jgi:hypothetical protein